VAIEIDLSNLTEDKLVDLNHQIIARLKRLRQMHRYEQMAAFDSGDRVAFASERGEIISGVVARFNQKSVTVHADGGQHWRVSPGLLMKTIDAAVAPARVIDLHPGPLFERKQG
jgi:hypothetical protein